tara:strand:+ start:20128 stop:20880 length:753 start_codon:yes stop_codon:yes gene_type:complete
MKTIFLHGKLGELYGEKWQLDVKTPAEAAKAINANKPGFLDYLSKKYQEGLEYKLKIGNSYVNEDDIEFKYPEQSYHIIPVARGGAFLANPWFWALLFVSAAVTYVMYSKSKPPRPEDPTQKSSFLFQGASNTVAQGNFIPIGYGRLRIGSQVIHSSQEAKIMNQISFNTKLNLNISTPTNATQWDLTYGEGTPQSLLNGGSPTRRGVDGRYVAPNDVIGKPPAWNPTIPPHIKKLHEQWDRQMRANWGK